MSWIKLPARFFLGFSCDPRKVFRAIAAYPGYFGDLVRYWRMRRADEYAPFPVTLRHLHPFLLDKAENAGNMGVYFHQDLYVARQVYQRRPTSHLDIGSRIDGFVSHLLTFMDVSIIDVRSLQGIDGLTCIRADARKLTSILDNSVMSLSCLHALEHFGLGRYGDEVDPRAWEKALSEMCRVLSPDGCLYLSVPVGKERLEFNGQRVFSVGSIARGLSSLEIQKVTFINKHGLINQMTDLKEFSDSQLNEIQGNIVIFEAKKLAKENDAVGIFFNSEPKS